MKINTQKILQSLCLLLLIGAMLTGCKSNSNPLPTVKTEETEEATEKKEDDGLNLAESDSSVELEKDSEEDIKYSVTEDNEGYEEPEAISEDDADMPDIPMDEAGPVLAGGILYCVGTDLQLLKDEYYGCLFFDSDGRYTSGNSELDMLTEQLILDLTAEDRTLSRIEILERGYYYMVHNYHYLKRSVYYEGASDWETDEAIVIMQTTKGNCYNFTAAFWALARNLGYQAYTVCKPMDSSGIAHAWTQIDFDGTAYIFDPQLEKNFGNNRYMLTYEEGYRYGYREPETADTET